MKFKTLKIENFRSIQKLEITDLGQVNIFIGRNNSGKTTVLEALFLLAGPTNPKLPVIIHNLRDLILDSNRDFLYLFKNLDEKWPPVLSAKLERNESRKLTIRPVVNSSNIEANVIPKGQKINSQISPKNSQTDSISTLIPTNFEAIRLEFEQQLNIKKPQHYFSEITLPSIEIKYPKDYNEKIIGSYLSRSLQPTDIVTKLDALIVEKKIDAILSLLKEIDSRIAGIQIGAKDMIYIDLGYNKLLPLNIMGDGLRKILNYAVTLASQPNAIFFIDEIENGLHHKNLAIMWNTLLKSAKTYKSQLFLTTHSYEALHILAAIEQHDVDVKIYRIESNERQHTSIEYSISDLREVMNLNWEVR